QRHLGVRQQRDLGAREASHEVPLRVRRGGRPATGDALRRSHDGARRARRDGERSVDTRRCDRARARHTGAEPAEHRYRSPDRVPKKRTFGLILRPAGHPGRSYTRSMFGGGGHGAWMLMRRSDELEKGYKLAPGTIPRALKLAGKYKGAITFFLIVTVGA